jgi:hypothetical protein
MGDSKSALARQLFNDRMLRNRLLDQLEHIAGVDSAPQMRVQVGGAMILTDEEVEERARRLITSINRDWASMSEPRRDAYSSNRRGRDARLRSSAQVCPRSDLALARHQARLAGAARGGCRSARCCAASIISGLSI